MTTEEEEYETQLDDIDFGITTTNYTNAREDVDDDFHDDNLEGFSNSWENEAPESKFSELERKFTELYATEDRWELRVYKECICTFVWQV